jgi:hypothetical protein
LIDWINAIESQTDIEFDFSKSIIKDCGCVVQFCIEGGVKYFNKDNPFIWEKEIKHPDIYKCDVEILFVKPTYYRLYLHLESRMDFSFSHIDDIKSFVKDCKRKMFISGR